MGSPSHSPKQRFGTSSKSSNVYSPRFSCSKSNLMFFLTGIILSSNSSGSEATFGVRLGPNSSSLFIEKRSFSDRSSRSEATSGVRLGPHNTTKKRVVLKKNQVFVDFSHTKGVEKITNNEGQRPVRVTRKHISVKNIDT